MMIQLTIWGRPDFKMETQYGTITHIDWLHKEDKRIESAPNRVAEIKLKNFGKFTEYALFVNNITKPFKANYKSVLPYREK